MFLDYETDMYRPTMGQLSVMNWKVCGFKNFAGGIEENHTHPHDIQSPRRDSKPRPPHSKHRNASLQCLVQQR